MTRRESSGWPYVAGEAVAVSTPDGRRAFIRVDDKPTGVNPIGGAAPHCFVRMLLSCFVLSLEIT